MRILKVLFLQIVMIMSSVAAIAAGEGEGNGFDWTPVMDAIIQVESKGNASAVSGQYVGAMQISPICVRECNNILKRRGQAEQDVMDKAKQWFTDNIPSQKLQLWWCDFELFIAEN